MCGGKDSDMFRKCQSFSLDVIVFINVPVMRNFSW
jgi:hypothetical protein